MSWNLNQTQSRIVAEETGVQENVVSNLINLFDQGNEIAYVARYRVDAHNGLPSQKVLQVFEAYLEGKEVNDKVGKAIASVQKKAETKEMAEAACEQLRSCRDTSEITEVTKIFATTKKTKASKAKELGLGEACEKILKGEVVDLRQFVDKRNTELRTLMNVEEHLKNLIADSLDKRPETVEAIKKISHLETTTSVRICTEVSKKASSDDIQHFASHIGQKIPAGNIKNDKVLAILRGEEKGVLTCTVSLDRAEYLHPGKCIRPARAHTQLFEDSLSYSITTMFLPKIRRGVKKFLAKRAEQGAIECFSTNLSQLFQQAGLKNYYVIALDPGYNSCKVASLDPNGTVIVTKTLPFHRNSFGSGGEESLKKLVDSTPGPVVIAIGNGSASTETQMAVENMISKKMFRKDVKFCVVSESGASKYSITPLAEEELPGIPVTEKSAVSIGRRLIDPVAEYVKIDPKHLGLGMYQHSVNEKKLSEALNLVVRNCVSLRGVDVNSASQQLLQQVCGLNKKTSAGIIDLRQKLGRISSRNELTKIKGLGAKSFQQAAGFLIVSPPQERSDEPPAKKRKKQTNTNYHPLDATTVHPEHYQQAEKILEDTGVAIEDIKNKSSKIKLQKYKPTNVDERLVIDLLTADPVLIPPPPLITGVRKITSLRKGEKILGRVMNNTDFGSFIDIGAECNALAHVSCLPKPAPEVGTYIEVEIKDCDVGRKRISVIPVN